MSSVHLESWVTQQYKENGFGRDGKGSFIGKSALKRQMINRYPQHKERIRQLVNAIKVPETLPKALPVITTASHAPNILVTAVPIPEQAPTGALSHTIQASNSTFRSDDNAIENAINRRVVDIETDDGGVALSRPSEDNRTTETQGAISQIRANPRIMELKNFLDRADGLEATTVDPASIMDLHLGLLSLDGAEEESSENQSRSESRNAVIFPGHLVSTSGQADFPQYGLLASLDPTDSTTSSDPRLFLNTNIPFSAFVCGVQGSGKSHTTACIVENCLIPSPALGVLSKPLSALVFNFAEYTSSSSFRPCELSYLAASASQAISGLGVKKVNVLVSPSNYPSLVALYMQIPGVTVQPFKLRPKDLNISTMLTLMSVDQTQSTPLYMGLVTKILRDMASESANSFNYPDFRRRLDDAGLDRKQEEFLKQRLDLLESFLDLDGTTSSPVFAAGEITIIDLSCPFVDASTACVLFKIGMGLYLESDSTTGKVIVLDEAHKYMTDTPASKALTESVMGVIRQQRHYGARVIISTQEPSISPQLIDLCSLTVMHRFSSPEWLGVLQKHILVADEEGDRGNKVGLLREIMRLRTGEALVFAPSAIFGADSPDGQRQRCGADALLKMRMRKRVTWDGGRSIVCV